MVDVLMSAYNAENTIERAVNSVLDQTYQRFKLYVFDDCSTDSTYDILKDISDPRLIVIHSNKNIGTYASKNYMLKNFCKSPYIALHDADDISEPRRLQLQVSGMFYRPNLACLGTSVNEILVDSGPHTISDDMFSGSERKNTYPSVLTKEDIRHLIDLEDDKVYDDYLKFKFCKNGSVLMRSKILHQLGGWDGRTRIAADTDLFIRILGLSEIHNLKTALYNRFFHKGSLTASKQYGIGSDIRRKYNLGRKEVIEKTLKSDPVVRDMWHPEIEVCVG
mgnify:FL=1